MEFSSYKLSIIMRNLTFYLCILTFFLSSFNSHSREINNPNPPFNTISTDTYNLHALMKYVSLRPDYDLTKSYSAFLRTITFCPSDFSVNVDSGTCGAVVTYTSPTTDIAGGHMELTSAYGQGDTFPLGATTVIYEERDSANNPTRLICSFVVTVVDNEVATITLNGANPQIIEACGTYNELGATANDICFGDISGSIIIDASAVNTAVVGTYTVTYDVTDAAGNVATQVTRTVNVVDTTAPTITLVGANPQTIEACGTYNELGATAHDICFGDISGSIIIDASAVNTAVVGTYTVTYDVTDAAGNVATQVTRTVNVVDTTAPTITLNGANPQTIEACGTYNELGATANDPCFGDITGSILIDASAVNTAVVGTYTVTYNVTDAAGNVATQVTRTVNVVDTSAPTITLVGANPQTIEACGTYNELGAMANDPCFGDISGSIIIDASAVNTAVVGSYTVTYNVTDAAGNVATQVTRTVNVVDTTAPTITLFGANPQTIEACGTYNELGATANDICFGDISGSIIIDASAVNTAVVGTYTVTYDVTDAAGNVATQVTRTVNVVDTTVPTITLVGANPQTIEACDTYNELGATAHDICFGDISGSIIIDASAVNTSVVGTYTVTYNVTDAAGNVATQVTRTVNVVDTTAPTITLVGANPQTIETCGTYNELGATANDPCFGDITGSILIDASAVNTAVVGTYTVTYNVTDAAGNVATQVTRTVNVVDTSAPTITLVGANPQTIEACGTYNELGAMANDPCFGDISGSIIIDASAVNTAVVGSYTVTYNVTDAAGNVATQVTRTVNVVDTTAPTITLVGANPQIIEACGTYNELEIVTAACRLRDISGSIIIAASAVNTAVVGT